MNYSGNITLSDSSRVANPTGISGFLFDVASTDNNPSLALDISGSTLLSGKNFFQGQILSRGDLPVTLKDWTYFGGHQQDATTWVDGTWMDRWFNPVYLKYSIWHQDYDTSQFSLVGYKFRDPGTVNTGEYYAPMVVPSLPGHYEARWIYLKDTSSYAREIVEPFVSVSRGLDAMKDYSNYALFNGSNIPPYTAYTTIETIPPYVLRNPGDNAVFTLKVNGPLPAPLSYYWRMNGNYIHDSALFSGTQTDTLTVYDATVGASFNCVVSDSIISTLSWLSMNSPPPPILGYFEQYGN